MSQFQKLVEFELTKARAAHGPQRSPHESYAVIAEELDEFWDEVRAKKHDHMKMLKELVQTAAMCQRAAEDLGFIKEYEDA